MRILNDEEIMWCQGSYPKCDDNTRAIAKAQHRRDIKDFIEDIEYHGEGCDMGGEIEPWKTAENIILPMWYLRDLKLEVKNER